MSEKQIRRTMKMIACRGGWMPDDETTRVPKTHDQAVALIHAWAERGVLWHFDTDPADMVSWRRRRMDEGTWPTFAPHVLPLLRLQVAALFCLLDDPFHWAIRAEKRANPELYADFKPDGDGDGA